MANFENSFTGKGTGLVMPSGERLDRAQQNMSEMILGAEKLKQETYQRNQQEFLKNANIDPAFVLATSAQETQSKMLDGFNAKWGKTMKERGGNLTTDDKMQMAKEKNFILMSQQKMVTDMQTMMLHQKTVAQYPNRWDTKEQAKRVDNYLKTGSYDYTEPPIKPLSLTDAAMKMQNKVATKEYMPQDEQKTYNVGGVPYKQSTIYSASKEDVIPYIKSAISDNDQYGAGVLKEWNELAPTDKEAYHKKNPQNPILEMAVDKHWKEWVTTKQKEEKNSPPSKSTFDWNVNVGSGHNQNSKFQDQGVQKIASAEGDFDLPNYKNLGQVSQTSETQNIPEVIVKDKSGNETVKKLNETALFHVVGFSDKTDKLVIQLDGNSSGDMTYMKGDVLVVPASGFSDLLQKKPFGIFRGQTTPTQPVKSTSGVTWAQPKKK